MKPIHIAILASIILLAIISTTLSTNLDESLPSSTLERTTPVTAPEVVIPVVNSHSKDEAPIIAHYLRNATGTNQAIEDLSNVTLPQSFIVAASQSQRMHIYQMSLNVGDAIGFEFNSTQRVGLSIYAIGIPNYTGGQPSQAWFSENATHISYGLIALKSGTYNFVFTSITPIDAKVTFNAWRVDWDPSELLFKESGGSSGGMGGMSWGTSSLEPPPRSFVVGRTWYGQYWTDRSISFEATLSAGMEAVFGYNATEPVIFNLSSDSESVISHDDLYSYNGTFRVPSAGTYTFSFDMAQTKTAIVSFRCRAENSSNLSYLGQTAALIEDPRINGVKLEYPFPPAITQSMTIIGKLGYSMFPNQDGKVMILNQKDSAKTFLLHIGTPIEFISAPTGGDAMLGNVTFTDLNNAYLGNSTITVTGFPFKLSLNGVVYDLFHVNSVDILGPYPLYAKYTYVKVSGYNNEIMDGNSVEYFPIRFDLGFTYSPTNGESYYGERFYSSYLKQGASVKISYNASKPVEFGLYSDYTDLPTVMSFDLGRPSDYIIRESGVQSFEQLFSVPRSGFYTFAFKPFSGNDASVTLDLTMTG